TLPVEILSLELGPPDWPVIALTDDGISVLRLDADLRPRFEPVIEDRSVLARSGALIPNLGLVHDLDGDGDRDLLHAARDGLAVYPGGRTWPPAPASRLALPTDERSTSRLGPQRRFPLPEVADIDGDGRADLLFPSHEKGWRSVEVLRGLGGGRFAALPEPLEMPPPPASEECPEGCPESGERLVFLGDLDGDGRAEYVTRRSLSADDAGMRQEFREAKSPPNRYRFFRSGSDLSPATEPYATLDALGYVIDVETDDEREFSIPGGFQDLDGDGRQDLVALTLDFSMMQIVRIMTTRTISVGLDFSLYCQTAEGGFREVPDLDLSGRFKLNLDDVRLSQLSLFDGDFDGDGRADFVQLGRGKTVSIHRGREGCAYPKKPDLVIQLAEEPRDLALVEIEDLDGDGLSDLRIVQPDGLDEPGVTPTVRLDLYLSRELAP
ncbi:MAG: VCBS repeat-containing protein, partial [Acidobacteriota bacterium]